MKHFILSSIITIISFHAAAQSTFSVHAKVNTGVGIQQGKLRNVYGIGGVVESPLKNLKALKVLGSLDIGVNGMKTLPYEFRFNGSVTNTDVRYTSNVIQLASGLKYMFRDNKMWSPYAALSAGAMSYYTSMTIEDPADPLGCSPTETRPVLFSLVLAGNAETGLRIKTKQRSRGSISFIEAGVAYTAGTRGKYLRFENDDEHHHAEDSYMVKFKQNSTGLEHEHGLGTVYKTTTSQLAYHIGIVFPL